MRRAMLSTVASAAILTILGPLHSLAAQDLQITVTARDYEFVAPDTVEAGVVRVRLVNEGESFHHAQLVRLGAGKTLEDLREALRTEEPEPWIDRVGGPGLIDPGNESIVTVALQPGTYVWVCFVSTDPPEGSPHYEEGMLRPMEVTGSGRPRLPDSADILLLLSDYDFKFSKPPTPGTHVLRVRNMSGQPHEVVFVRFHEGKTMEDLMAWAATREGPRPADPLGGVMALDEGHVNLMELALTPGEYGIMCFVPDKVDGRPHAAHGMAKSFSVP